MAMKKITMPRPDQRIEKMKEIGLARAKASMPVVDRDLQQVEAVCRKYLGEDTVAGQRTDDSLLSLFNSNARPEIRLALNILAAEHARQVLQSEQTAAGLEGRDLSFIFSYANLNSAVWNIIDDAGPDVDTLLTRFPGMTPERINAVMPDFQRPVFVPAAPLSRGIRR